MRIKLRGASVVLLFTLLLSCVLPVHGAVTQADVDAAIAQTARYLATNLPQPQVGAQGGEWAVLALARSGYDLPAAYDQAYYANLTSYVEARKGTLHDKKYTEYARVILALTALGKDPTNVGGYNLLTPLGDYDKTIWQGLNGPIWALIALDAGQYPMPENKQATVQATRELYIDRILAGQLPDGGFSLVGGMNAPMGMDAPMGTDAVGDADITGMALTALAPYQHRADVKGATEKALAWMSTWEPANAESTVQLLVALTALGIPLDDPRFVQQGNTLLDSLMACYRPDGGFSHGTGSGDTDQMATEQGLCGLVAAQRLLAGKPSLYHMTDALPLEQGTPPTAPAAGLAGKHMDIQKVPVTKPGTTFGDVAGEDAPAVEGLAARGILQGKTETAFAPDDTVTRAEFAAMVVRGLGLTPRENGAFTDVTSGQWFSAYAGTANAYGIVTGKSADSFDPMGLITREEAAVMTARAAKLCGLSTTREVTEIRDALAPFPDYMTVSSWAWEAVAVCYDLNLLPQQDENIRPAQPMLRREIAQMLFRLLQRAALL